MQSEIGFLLIELSIPPLYSRLSCRKYRHSVDASGTLRAMLKMHIQSSHTIHSSMFPMRHIRKKEDELSILNFIFLFFRFLLAVCYRMLPLAPLLHALRG